MKHYIDKDALVSEIERRKNICNNVVTTSETPVYVDYYQGKAEAYRETLSFLDTLEVKEVDLEKETDKWYNNEAPKEFENVLYKDIEKCAKHFFELGIKLQKGKQL